MDGFKVINKKQIKRRLKRIQHVKTWQLVIVLFLSLLVNATLLRMNNINMVERRNLVLSADREKDEEKIKDKLYELQRYVTSHMNTNMGKGIYLETSYQTAVKRAYDEVINDETQNIYKAAQDICVPKFANWSQVYVSCVAEELAKYPEGDNLASTVTKPSPDSFLHVFASPLWSPDFAGLSVMFSVVILIMILTRIIGVIILNLLLKIKYHSI